MKGAVTGAAGRRASDICLFRITSDSKFPVGRGLERVLKGTRPIVARSKGEGMGLE